MCNRKGLICKQAKSDTHLVNFGPAGAMLWQKVALGPMLCKGSLRNNNELAKYSSLFRYLDDCKPIFESRSAEVYGPFDGFDFDNDVHEP